MKFALSVAVLALAASQAMAVMPKPTPGCAKTVQVKPTDTTCDQFAADNGITLKQLLAWNIKLHNNCDNLDVDAYMCVAFGGEPQAPVTATNSGAPKPTATAPVVTSSAPRPTSAPRSNGAASSAAQSNAPTATGPAGATRSSAPFNAPTGAASTNKGSLLIAAAGVILSVAYMV
ncbi:hypothetical protein BGW42_004475 [Actinomortierella wolfii]|nr:hypothetical protein BGW42_004475 [Actinomortierella wolfii]